MPLRAILNNQSIQSYEFSKEAWGQLKAYYKTQPLRMACCQRNAIPKTSRLGTQYFAHARRGECTSAAETKEHLELKAIIATTAKLLGWEVSTEHEGLTPEGEKWVADVMCIKGNAKIAIEVQWSRQVTEEYIRRTKKYADSGVRCAWLFRLHGKEQYWGGQIIESYELPYFGVRQLDGNYLVARYGVSVSKFIEGMLSGDLKYSPLPNEVLSYRVDLRDVQCRRCKLKTNMIEGVSVRNARLNNLEYFEFDETIAQWMSNHFFIETLRENGVGEIKPRWDSSFKRKIYSNGCLHCDRILSEYDYYDNWSYSSEAFELRSDQVSIPLEVDGKWFFMNSEGKYRY